MKNIQIITEVELDDDFEGDLSSVVEFISATLDNAPAPEDIDETLKGMSIGISYN